MEFDLNAMITQAGGNIIEPSSLNNEAKENTEGTPVVETTTTETTEKTTPVTETTTATTTEVKETEVKSGELVIGNKEVALTPVAETQPEPEVEKTKGWDVYQTIDKQFKEENGVSMVFAKEIADTDFNAMEETDLIEQYMFFKDPDITDMEINAEILPYNILFEPIEVQEKAIEDGKYTREEIQILNAKFEGLKRNALKFMTGKQNEYKDKLENFQVAGKNNNSEEKARTTLINESNNFLSTYSTEKIEIREGDKVIDSFDFSVNETDKKLLSDIMADPSLVYKMWMNEKGIDVAKMMKDLNSLVVRDKMNALIYNQGLAKGASKDVKETSNINFEATQQPTTQKTAIPEGMQRLINHAVGG